MRIQLKLWVAAPLLALTYSSAAHAFELGACGSTTAGWNAPAGAAVGEHTDGMINSIMNAIGEYRTHIVLSHGTNGWITHATTAQPTLQDSGCANYPLTPSELAHGYPGWSQTDVGGHYGFLFGGSRADYVHWQLPTDFIIHSINPLSVDLGPDGLAAKGVGEYLWYSTPYQWVPSQINGAYGLYLLGTDTPSIGFHHIPYAFDDYVDRDHHDGTVCSTSLADAYYRWQKSAHPDDSTYPRPEVANHFYTKAQVTFAGSQLWWAVQNKCRDTVEDMASRVGWPAASLGAKFLHGSDCDITDSCNHVSWQVLNCFEFGPNIQGSCTDVEGTNWSGYVNDPLNQNGAMSVSPDLLLGKSGLPTNSSVWAPYADHTVLWNAPGNTYGCWM